MEFLQEPTYTVLLAIMLTFIIAKIVSFAVSSSDTDENTLSCSVNEGPVAEELTFTKGLRVGSGGEKRKAKFVDDTLVRGIDRYEGFENLPLLDITSAGEKNVDGKLKVGFDQFVENDVKEAIKDNCVDGVAQENGSEKVDGGSNEDLKISRTSLPKSEEGEGINLEGCDENEAKVRFEVVKDEDDDDWEGIERSELEKVFAEAVNYLEYGAKGKHRDVEDNRPANLGSDVLIELYGLHKVAVEGPCHEPQPMAFMVAARAKWNAWQKLGHMSRELAMERYVKILSDNLPGWLHGYSNVNDIDMHVLSKLETNDKISEFERNRISELGDKQIGDFGNLQRSIEKVDTV